MGQEEDVSYWYNKKILQIPWYPPVDTLSRISSDAGKISFNGVSENL